jgi:mannosyltransferase OCH1-like enzyme
MPILIPKIFHQIWINEKSPELPPDFSRYRDTWLELHPGWEYKLWNLNNLDFPLITAGLVNKSANYAQMADILRYEILYQYGGVYIDTDFDVSKY